MKKKKILDYEHDFYIISNQNLLFWTSCAVEAKFKLIKWRIFIRHSFFFFECFKMLCKWRFKPKFKGNSDRKRIFRYLISQNRLSLKIRAGIRRYAYYLHIKNFINSSQLHFNLFSIFIAISSKVIIFHLNYPLSEALC